MQRRVDPLYGVARCDAEQTEEALTAREQIHKAEELLAAKASLNEARENFEKAWDNWELVRSTSERLGRRRRVWPQQPLAAR